MSAALTHSRMVLWGAIHGLESMNTEGVKYVLSAILLRFCEKCGRQKTDGDCGICFEISTVVE